MTSIAVTDSFPSGRDATFVFEERLLLDASMRMDDAGIYQKLFAHCLGARCT
jgi:hypothetical protein